MFTPKNNGLGPEILTELAQKKLTYIENNSQS
jgi:hypothetical protein